MTGKMDSQNRRSGLKFSALLVWLCLAYAPPSVAADLRVIAHQTGAYFAPARPDWPQPADQGQVFYLQRSMNANTVVYSAHMQAGALDQATPLHAYWRRFNDGGEVKPLKPFERRLAYGVRARKQGDGYVIRFAGLPQLRPVLRLDKSGKPALWADYGGRQIRLISGYLELDETGMIPRVTGLRIHGMDPITGRQHLVTFAVSDGVLKQ
ncbi:MAG: DUF4833 domain-containing protein [Paracoccaceae bacterium]